MKRKELLIIGGVAFVAALFSLVLSGVLFGSPKKNPIKVPVVNQISSQFPVPQSDDNYKKFFNYEANNPTKLIEIGNNNNTNPFHGANQ
jgi:hypothetical protein